MRYMSKNNASLLRGSARQTAFALTGSAQTRLPSDGATCGASSPRPHPRRSRPAAQCPTRRPLVAKILKIKGVTPDENSMYLYSNYIEMVWPYDDRGRLVGENFWEPEPEKAEIIKLDRTEVLTVAQAAESSTPSSSRCRLSTKPRCVLFAACGTLRAGVKIQST
jgi:hypothetical protein